MHLLDVGQDSDDTTNPSRKVYLADDRATSHEQNGDSFMMNAEEIVGREKAGKPLAETNKSPSPGGATATSASKEPKGIASGNVAFTLVTCLLVLCCLLIFQVFNHMNSPATSAQMSSVSTDPDAAVCLAQAPVTHGLLPRVISTAP